MLNIRRVHPGEFIKDDLEVMQMTNKEFAIRSGISERTLSDIINGKGSITFDVAYKLSNFFDSSVEYWMNAQNAYDLYIREQEEKENKKQELSYAKKVKGYAEDIDLVDSNASYDELIKALRKFAGVNNLTLLKEDQPLVCYKKQMVKKESDPFYKNFWIASVLTKARENEVAEYNKKKLLDSMNEIKALTMGDLNNVGQKIDDILKECGVSFVLLPYLSKSNIYGITKWLSKDKVMVAISDRNKKLDSLIFTLFHELSHVLMEHKREALVQEDGYIDEHADEFAKNFLIDKNEWNSFINGNSLINIISIINFANKLGVHPSIVLGRLQKEGIVGYDRFNDLKVSCCIKYL